MFLPIPMATIDSIVAVCLLPLAVFVLISGLDDLALDLAMLARWVRGRMRRDGQAEPPAPQDAPERRIAIFVPLWREHAVAGRMLAHNLAAIRYGSYDIFAGAYPNDEPTLDAIRQAETRFASVHLAVCPHDGPTSKADCLNWIYQRMLLYEEQHGVRFEIVVTHDAEDLVHPDSLRWINRHAGQYDMVQVPVLPLPTPFRAFTHGVYCDEFAEYQSRDVPLRTALGGFLPSNGVGTGYTRRALETLAEYASNRIFEPDCLTEDYEAGLRLHRLGFRQVFLPIRFAGGQPVATREYFPLSLRQAVRQRTRWVIGIALQAWQRHGWGSDFPTIYWFWRDRKGLLGNPASLLGNAIFTYGAATWAWSSLNGCEWGLAQAGVAHALRWLLLPALCFQAARLGVRTGCSGRIYGWRFALGVPVRIFWANWMNSIATVLAICRYTQARLLHLPLRWVKTEHLYPSREALTPLGMLAEDELLEALGLARNLPAEVIDPRRVSREAVRMLPARLARSWKVLPYKVEGGSLFLAGPEPLSDAFQQQLRGHTRLRVRFQLITQSEYDRLRKQLA